MGADHIQEFMRVEQCQLETGSWKLEAGNWKLEAGNWKLETGKNHSQGHAGIIYGFGIVLANWLFTNSHQSPTLAPAASPALQSPVAAREGSCPWPYQ